MKSITSNWFECQIIYDKIMDNGTQKKTTEVYTVDALTFTEAESRIIEEMKPFISGEFNVKNINPTPYKEIFFSENDKDDRWYKVKIAFITFDENTHKEKETKVTYLVQGNNAEKASSYVNEIMNNAMADYRIIGNIETKILDVSQHQ
ncbi:MAG: DUF4494 domain-containing protein [Paludibacteraceae bacterium]|nr:DUF4494 domain-containing protein [Paludibacteraceae bacterium]